MLVYHLNQRKTVRIISLRLLRSKKTLNIKPGTKIVTESDVADAVLDIMNVSKLPSNMEEMAAQLDDQDYMYVSTRRPKRRLDHEYHDEEPKKKKTLFQKVHQLLIEEIDQVENITSCNSTTNKWITINFK